MPLNRTISPAPYSYTGMNAYQTAILFLLLLLLHLTVMGIMRDFIGIGLIFCTATAAVASSVLINYRQGKIVFDIHALVAGLLMGFFLPANGGFVFSFFIAFMSYFLSWGIFGGRGFSWINPVMLAACIAAVCKPGCFVQPVGIEQIRAAGSVFAALEASDVVRVSADQHLTSMLNSILHGIGVTLPEGYISLFLSYPSTIPAFRYNMLTLFSSIVLLSSRSIQKMLPFSFLAVYGILVYFFPFTVRASAFGRGDILSALLTSGSLFTAFFVIHDSGSTPRSQIGRLVSGILTGTFAFCITGSGASPVGIPFAVLLSDCINPLIGWFEESFYKRRRTAL